MFKLLASFRASHPDSATPLRIPWIVILLCCTLPILGVLSNAHNMGWPKYLESADIRPYYTGGALVANGEGAQLYDLDAQWLAQQKAFPGVTNPDDLLPYLAPPFVAAPMALLAKLPVKSAFLIWLACNWFFLSVLTYRFVQALAPSGRRAQIAVVVLCITCAPVFVTLMQGQWALVLALSSFFTWQGLRSNRPFRGGLWLSLWLFKPQLLILPIVILLWKKQIRALSGFALGSAFLGIVSFAIIGLEGFESYSQLLKTASGWSNKFGVRPEAMYTWRGVLYNFTNETNFLWWLGVVPMLLILIWSWRGAWPLTPAIPRTMNERRSDPMRFDACWAMTIFAALFCSPYLYYHDLTLLLVPVLLIAVVGQSSDGVVSPNSKSFLLILPVFGFALFWFAFNTARTSLAMVAPTVFYMTLCFVVLSIFVARQRRVSQTTNS